MTIPVNPMPVDSRAYTNITPFTVRDNATYIIVLESMRTYINNVLVPFINKNVEDLDESWKEKVNELVAEWNQLSADLIEQVEDIASQLGSSVEDAQTARDAAIAAAELAEQFASDMEAFQDNAITNIFNNAATDFRQAFNVVMENLIREDEGDPGTFILSTVTPDPEPGGSIVPDPNDPGFFV